MRRRLMALTVLLAAAGASASEAGEAVRIDLPVRARLAMADYDSLAIVPFITVQQEEGVTALPELERELLRYLTRTVERGTELRVDPIWVDLPTTDTTALAANGAFWQAVGERSGADLILAGAVDFDLHDRSGYVTREFVSDHDGRTYHSQVLIEETGVELDLLIWVFEARSGRLLLADNLKDFRSFQGESVDPLTGLFSNLARLEDRLLGIFAQRTVSAERLLQ